MHHIVTNVDQNYFLNKHGNWVQSVLKNKNEDQCKIFLITDQPTSNFISHTLNQIPIKVTNNTIEIPNLEIIKIDPKEIQYSKHPNLKNRPNFVCLESGEFINFYNFKDDDIVTLCDWDITMQRAMTENEINIINNLNPQHFAMNRDYYPNWPGGLHKYLDLNTIFDDIDPNWIIYNTGIQTAKVSAWKSLFNYWKEYYDKTFSKLTHHAAGQALFNYIINKHDMLTEMPPTYHNAHWFPGSPVNFKENKLWVNNEPVLFNHHKFAYLPNY
jgi:hypothetical protein